MEYGDATIANDAATASFAELDVKAIALLLDVDGTLIDIGPSPNDVHVADDLRDSLARLSRLTGGALALVSGRPIADLDALFAPLKLPAVGGHGAETRRMRRCRDAAAPLPPVGRHLAEAATPGSGIIVEDKGYSLALHYRKAPQYESPALAYCGRPCGISHRSDGSAAGQGDARVKWPNVSKGDGVRDLMSYPPFAGRMPVFIGDDVTDESVLRRCLA